MLHVNYVRYSEARLTREHCPNCKKRTFFASLTCLRCGDSWKGSEMRERPFERGWRERIVMEAKYAYRKWRWKGKTMTGRVSEFINARLKGKAGE